MKGTIKTLVTEKGFGFILGEDGKEYFFHRSGIDGFGSIRLGDKVDFTSVTSTKGPRAENVFCL